MLLGEVVGHQEQNVQEEVEGHQEEEVVVGASLHQTGEVEEEATSLLLGVEEELGGRTAHLGVQGRLGDHQVQQLPASLEKR